MKRYRGYTLVEILISLVIVSLVTAGVFTFFSANKRVNLQEDITTTVEANLRIGMNRIITSLRNGGYGIPDSNLSAWMPWVTGFSSDPVVITDGIGTNPDAVSIASCTSQPIMSLSADASAGDTTLTVSDESLVDTANRRLILIDESEHAHVKSTGSGTIVIDTDVSTAGNQGLTNAYPTGANICRIDVTSFDVDNNKLRRNENDGAGAQRQVDGIENLQIQTITAGVQYQVTLTARSDRKDPGTGTFPTRSMTTTVTLKN